MNKILNNKININMINIIGEYNLYISIDMNFVLGALIGKTFDIKYNLITNFCTDDLTNFYNDLENTKIRHITSNHCHYYWVIRKC